MGLGDHFICNGLVNHYSERYIIHLPCKVQYLNTIKSLYQDNMHVKVFPIFHEPHDIESYARTHKIPIMPVGFQNLGINNTVWYKSFYSQYDVPYDFRYEKFKLPTDQSQSRMLFDRLNIHEPYALVHNTSGANAGGYPLHLMIPGHIRRVIKIDNHISKNLLDWLEVIKHAEEIHVVPSSVFCLVDGIADTLTAKLFYHDIRLHTGILDSDIMRPNTNWKVIKYDQQL